MFFSSFLQSTLLEGGNDLTLGGGGGGERQGGTPLISRGPIVNMKLMYTSEPAVVQESSSTTLYCRPAVLGALLGRAWYHSFAILRMDAIAFGLILTGRSVAMVKTS